MAESVRRGRTKGAAVSPRGPLTRFLAASTAAGALVLLAFAHFPATPAGAATPSYYLALGDSLATGVGAPSGAGYVDDLATAYGRSVPGLQLMNLSCPGETTDSMISGSCKSGQSQLSAAEAFLRAHPGQVSALTIDIGGNDVVSCASTGSIDVACFGRVAGTVVSNIKTIMSRLRAAAGPSTPMIGMNYFDPFLVLWLQPSTRSVATQTAQLDHAFSGLLGQAYGASGTPVADVEGAFATQDFTNMVTRPYGTVPVSVANACDWLTMTCTATGFSGSFDIHANATGYQVVARAFEAVTPPLVPGSVAGPGPTTTTQPPTTRSSPRKLAATGRNVGALATTGSLAIVLGLLLLWGSRTRDPSGCVVSRRIAP